MIEDEYLGLWEILPGKGFKDNDPFAYWIVEQFYDYKLIQKMIKTL